ncbi:sex-lethal homolog isoform X2 [Anthonomus grandis grandis]|uniref:sex-lethal homolog isoform X2 n=1 Tax=Anthonomus grandis grandis TaxID=2921223 RepID=UPI0021669226|nr:sex-lethal homolog isoform X2 [Anthonomus grandis grandis]
MYFGMITEKSQVLSCPIRCRKIKNTFASSVQFREHIGFQEDYLRNMEQNNGSGDSCSGGLDKTKLIVNYIPQFATEEDLGQIFVPLGNVESIKIMRDYKTGYSYGFGFVKYYKEEDAAKAINMLNGFNFRNKRLKVSYSRPPGTDMRDSNLYITNLPKDVTEQDVENLFKDYGEIVQRTVLKDKHTGMPRGVAFVRFSKGEEAQAAIANLDGKLLENAMLPLSVRVAEDHGRQKAQYLEAWNPLGPGLGFPPLRTSLLPFRDMTIPTRPILPNRFTRFPTYTSPNVRNLGAGDTFFQNPFFY